MNWQSKSAAVAIAIMAMSLHSSSVQAMPEQGKVVAGQGEIARPDDKTMVINQKTDRLALDWQKFNIAKDEKVHFDQNSKSAIAINRVVGDGRSIIDGSLSATGNVFVINPNGVLFGKNSSVDVGGLVASTAHVTDDDLKNFTQGKGDLGLQIAAGREASVINAGTIKAEGGLVALHATTVENTGTIANEGGTTALAAAKNLNIAADTAGKLNFTVNGRLANAKALNSGMLQSDGGYIVMTAKSAGDVMSTVVNNTGIIEAKTLHTNDKGEILLDGGASGQVEVSGTLNASGMEAGQSAGSIKVIGEKTVINDGTNLLARGTIDGGKIETSGDVLNLGNNLNIDAKGENGKTGEWLLDPLEILIQDDQPTQSSMDQTVSTVNEGSETQINYNDPPSATQNADSTYNSTSWIRTGLITEILNNGTDVTIQAASTSQAASITVNSAIKPKVEGDGEATLTLEAQRNITINKEIEADASGGKLNVKLNSDTDGDGVGAVIINADISTNGGTFTSGSGGNVKFDATQKENGNTIYETENGKVKVDAFGNKVPKYLTAGYSSGGVYSGTANIEGNTVGTYFGYETPAGQKVTEVSEDRSITTNGGDINLYGEVSIGLNGGTLTLDTSKTGEKGGLVNITGIINSGNSYDALIYGTDKWNQLVSDTVEKYIEAGTVPSYHFVGIYYTKNEDGTYSYTTTPHDFKQGKTHYAFHELQSGDTVKSNWTYPTTEETLDTQDTRWYTTDTAGKGYNSFLMEATTPTTSKMSIDDWLLYYRRTDPANYATRYANGNASNVVTYDQIKADTTTTRMDNLKADISALLAHNWYASETLAKSGTGANPGDSYLATITTALENSLSTPNSQKTLWVGGMGSGVRNKTNDKVRIFTHTPADPTHPDGFYWVTGPEGLVTNTLTYTTSDGTKVPIQGTKFWDTSDSDYTKNNYGKQVYGYTKWSSWSGGGQPDNSAPFLTVGYGNNNAWDDASVGGESTVGFVQETNLYNSSLNIKTGGGDAMLQGDIGKSVGLDTVSIDAGTGSVTTGNKANNATQYNHGTIYADHGVYINGGTVNVGGEIHSGGTDVEATKNTEASFKDYLDNVTINSAGNLTVHGIEVNSPTDSTGAPTSRTDDNGGKIKLTSTGTEGVITLGDGVDYNGKNTNGGVLKATSTANDAVVIDAQGTKSKFENKTTSTKAIDTQGKWKIYSASPEQNTFGKNLNSETDAQWTSKSTKFAANSTNENKFIFQTTPTITLYAEDQLKTYGDDLTEKLPSYLKSREEFKGLDGNNHNVNEFTDAFQEKDYLKYIKLPEGQSVTVTSEGAAGTATRNNGDYLATEKSGKDGKKAVYDLNVNLNGATALDGYKLINENAKIEIKKRQVSITSSGEQTYGNSQYTSWQDEKKGFVNGDEATFTYDHGIKNGSDYEASLNKTPGRVTADAGEYNASVSYNNLNISGKKNKDNSENPDFFDENYTLDTQNSSGKIKVNKADLTLEIADINKDYGDVDGIKKAANADGSYKIEGFVNGDDDPETKSALISKINVQNDISNALTGEGKHTQDVNGRTGYDIDTSYANTLSNYNVVKTNTGKVTLNKKHLTVDVKNINKDYGDVEGIKDAATAADAYTVSGFVNGDDTATKKDALIKEANVQNDVSAALTDDGQHTQDVNGDTGYKIKTTKKDELTNYIVDVNDGKVTLNKKHLTVDVKNINKDYGDVEGIKDAAAAADAYTVSGFVNGDDTATKKDALIKEANVHNDVSAALTDDGQHTQDVNGDTGYKIKTTKKDELKNYIVDVNDGKVTLNKKQLTVATNDVNIDYGTDYATTVGKTKSTVMGLTNGDQDKASDIFYDYGNYGGGYIEGNTKTNHVGDYDFKTTVGNKSGDFLKNYTISGGDATLTIDPKDVYFHVTGNGTTLGDVVYMVTDPNHPSSSNPINGQLVYGETVTPSYRPDGLLPNGHYGVSTSLDGKTISDKDVYGNYRYHYDGDITVSMPNKPDFEPPVNPPVTPGTGTVTPLPEQPTNSFSNTPENTTETTGHKTVWDGDRGGDRPEDKRVVTLPFFKVLEDKTTHRYGTYDVAKRTTEVKIEPSAQVLPEPNQPATQYRELTTELTTDKGMGEFTLKYNGSRFTILPDDDAAMKLIVVGDETKNRALFEKALHVAFTQMGLEVADLDGVYIHFGKD